MDSLHINESTCAVDTSSYEKMHLIWNNLGRNFILAAHGNSLELIMSWTSLTTKLECEQNEVLSPSFQIYFSQQSMKLNVIRVTVFVSMSIDVM